MLPFEPLGMVALANGTYSDQKSGKSALQNGHCSPPVVPAPKYKRRRVSAVRDFPPGCGRFAQQIIPRDGNGRQNSIGEESINGVTHVENGASGLFEDLRDVVAATLGDDTISLLLDNKFFLPSDGPIAVSNGNGSEKRVRKYPPRRKVSAVRDFPPNCGRNAPCLGDIELTKLQVCPENKSSSEPEKLDCSRVNEQTPTEALSVDDRRTVDGVHDGDSFERLESIMKDKTQKGSGKLDVKKTVDAHEGGLGGNYLDDIVLKVTKVAVEAKKFVESCASSKGKTIVDDKPAVGDAQPKGSPEVNTSRKKKRKKSEVLGDRSKVSVDKAHHESESEMELFGKQEEKHDEPPYEGKLYWWDHEFEAMEAKGSDGSEEDLGKLVYGSDAKVEKEGESESVVVQGLMVESNCPWWEGKKGSTSMTLEDKSPRKGKKLDMTSPKVGLKTKMTARKNVDGCGLGESSQMLTKMTARKKVDGNDSREKSLKQISPKAKSQVMDQLVVWKEEKSVQHDQGRDTPSISRSIEIYVPPLHPGTSGTDQDGEGSVTRSKVKETLRLYQAVCRKLLQGDEVKSKAGKKAHKRVDLDAAKIFKDRKLYINGSEHIMGSVPGVEVGDEYQYRTELNIIGLHRQIQGGIDYVRHNGKIVATSVVASGGYADDLDNSDVLIYTGQGGNVMNSKKEPEDQKLERGNLALKNSVDEKNPIRVVRGYESGDGKSSKTYVYDGLYLAEKFRQVEGPHGKLVYQFQLERIPGQPELAWKEVKKRKKCKVREGICDNDISQGKEKIPICAVNMIDDEKPPPFKYITNRIYPEWYNPAPAEGCNCTTRCSDSAKCSCTVKNGGEIPFNHNGAIVEVKPLVYECGPACRCSSSCHNRVSQLGIKYQLEIFKTQRMGWGVRSVNSIPSGSFICEYVGELLREKDADQRTGNDEYLFDIGNNYNDNTLWDGLSSLIPDAHHVASSEAVGDECFTIDAAKYGNVGRFINHSCTPNLYAQNILFDHGDRRFPRIMLFAAENIPPLQELTYHYNYTLDQVRDLNGNIKKKSCFCGSHECTGRLY